MEPERATVKIIEEKPFVHGVHGDRKGSPLLYFGFAGRSTLQVGVVIARVAMIIHRLCPTGLKH